jgi:hypothetical protein
MHNTYEGGRGEEVIWPKIDSLLLEEELAAGTADQRRCTLLC